MTGKNPTDRSKLGRTKRHVLTNKKGILISAVISSASTHDIKLVTDVVYNVVVKRPSSYKTKTTGRRRKLQHICLDKVYNSESEEQELVNQGYVLHIPYKRKRDEKKKKEEVKVIAQHCSHRKKYSAKRWVVERTNSWHNRFRKLFTRYEKKVENYFGLVQLSCCMIIYRKMILG